MLYRFLTSLIFYNPVDPVVDKALQDLIKTGLKQVLPMDDNTYAMVMFNDGSIYTFWNVNRYYSWLSEGQFSFPNGVVYKYQSARPSAKTMYLFKKALYSLTYSKQVQGNRPPTTSTYERFGRKW